MLGDSASPRQAAVKTAPLAERRGNRDRAERNTTHVWSAFSSPSPFLLSDSSPQWENSGAAVNKAALICPHLGPPVGSFFKILAPGKSQRLQNLSTSCLSFSHNNPDNPSSGQRSGRCVFNWCEVCACEYHGLFFTKSVKVMPKGQSLGMKSSGHLNSGKRHEAEPGATVCLSKREIYTVALRFAERES